MRKAISNLRVDKLKRRGLLTGYYHKYQTLKTVRLGWFHCRNIRVHVDLRQTVSIVPRIMFYKKRYHIHLLVRTFRASEPAQFRSPFYDPKSFASKSNPMSQSTPTYHPIATACAEELVRNRQAAANIVLWSGWFCPFSQRTWIALEEKGLPYQYKEVNPYLKEETFLGISEQSSRSTSMNR